MTLVPPQVTVQGASVESLNVALAPIGNYRVNAVGTAFEIPAFLKTYYPLFLVMGLIAITSFAGSSWMMNFMAGFYIVFGAFKLLDVPAFANSYARYDVIARSFNWWGYVYPFVEVALGLAFLFWFQMQAAAWLALPGRNSWPVPSPAWQCRCASRSSHYWQCLRESDSDRHRRRPPAWLFR